MRRLPPLARLAVSLVVLALLALVLEPSDIGARLAGLRREWVALALGLSVLQVCASAWRWRFTAHRLGVSLSGRAALREYYLATFLNQVLPGGIVGDVSRAWRHGRVGAPGDPGVATGRRGIALAAVHAVVLERASGQVVMTGLALVSAALLLARDGAGLGLTAGLAAGAALALLAARGLARRVSRLTVGERLMNDARRVLLEGPAPWVQLGSSLFVVATYLATWVAATRAVGISTPLPVLLPLVAPVLVTMLLPVTVAGWGVREAAAAALWGAMGLGPAEGVAISVAYGLLTLAGSLPGAGVLAFSLATGRDRDRTGGRSPVGNAAQGVGVPRPGSRSRAG